MKYASKQDEQYAPNAVIEALTQGGVKYVFGMPGGLTGPLWRALYNHPVIRAIQVREESIGSLMAEAYGRLTGQPAVVMGQGEWIVGNAGQGYLEALLGCSPLVILTEMSDGASFSHHAPYQSGTGDYGTWDARSALEGVTKRVMISHSPAQAVQHTQLALKHALTGQPGPVAVVFHSSSLRGKVGPTSIPRIYPTTAYLPIASRSIDESAIRDAADDIRAARRPVIIAGNGVRISQAQESLLRFAQAVDAPVVTTSSGKGIIGETNEISAGVMGPFGWPLANAIIAESDVVIAVGTKLGPSDTIDENVMLLDPERQIFVQIDIEPLNAAWTFPVDHVLIGDAGFVMDRLADSIVSPPLREEEDKAAVRTDALRAAYGDSSEPQCESNEVPFAPQRIIRLLEEAYPEDGIVSCDAGENRLFMMQWYRSKRRGEYLQPAAGGGMGYSVPAAMAAKLVHPNRASLAVCGDGGFGMSLHALMTARQEDLPIGVLVFNNGALGWVLHGMGNEAVAAHFAKFDYAAAAQALGCDGIRVTNVSELKGALQLLSNLSRPLVIDVPTSLDTSFKDVAFELVSAERVRTGY
jgi:acetolactate synthase-1/2/3 large subunit